MAVNLGNLIVNLKLDTANMDRNLLRSQKKLNKFTQNITDIGKNLQSLGIKMTAFVSLPIALVGLEAVKASAEMEAMTTSFEALLGNKSRAEDFVAVISKFSAETPFQIQDIGKASKILLSFGRSAQEVEEDLQNIGNVAAALGADIAEVAKTFGKVFGKEIIQTEEIWQLTERGIPILAELGAITGKTTGQLLKMAEKQELTADLMIEAFRRMSGEGGRFQDFMLKMSKTMLGIWSNFKDNMFLMLVQFGDMIVETIKLKDIMNGLIESLKDVAKWFKTLSDPMRKFIVFAMLAAAALGPLILLIGTLVVALGSLSAAILAVQIVLIPALFNPVTLAIIAVVAGIALLIGALVFVGALFLEAFGKGSTFFEKLNNLAIGSGKIFAEWGLGLNSVFDSIAIGMRLLMVEFEFMFKSMANGLKLMVDIQAFRMDPVTAIQQFIENQNKLLTDAALQTFKILSGDIKPRKEGKGAPGAKAKEGEPKPKVTDPVKKFADIIKAGSVKDFQIRNRLMEAEKTTETKNQEANETTAKNTKKMAEEQKKTNVILTKNMSVTVGIQ